MILLRSSGIIDAVTAMTGIARVAAPCRSYSGTATSPQP
jgi:hypothetical protein